MRGARPRLEQKLDPATALRQATPQRIRSHLSLDQFLPQHALRDDTQPLLAHELGRFQRVRIQIRQNVFRNVVQSFFCNSEK